MKIRLILISCFLSIIPLSLLQAYQYFRSESSAIEARSEDNIRELKISSEEVISILSTSLDTISLLSQLSLATVSIEYNRPEALNEYLVRTIEKNNNFQRVDVFDSEDSLFTSTFYSQERELSNFYGQTQSVANELRKLDVNTIISFRLEKELPTFYVASKIFNTEKELSGFLVGQISNDIIRSQLEKLQSRLGSPTGKKIHPLFKITNNDDYECSPVQSGQVQLLFLCYTEEKIGPLYWLNSATILLALALVVLAALYFFIYKFFIGRILSPLYEFLSNIAEISTGKILPLTSNSKYPEVNKLIDASNIIGKKLREFQDGEIERTKNETVAKVASQVAHDIRSPLTSLEYLLRNSGSKLAEADRVIANQSLERISDILSTLSMKGEKSQAGELKKELIETLVKRIVSEKRLEFQKYNNVEITVLSQVPYGTFVLVSKADFYRALSNLINNSAEARMADKILRIEIEISLDNGQCSIEIKDNGKGIPPESVSRVFDLGVSVDKPQGSGLGLTTARETIKKSNGTLLLESKLGVGTLIKIHLPICPSPSWFENKLLFNHSSVCIIDDDPSIHSIWDEILICPFPLNRHHLIPT